MGYFGGGRRDADEDDDQGAPTMTHGRPVAGITIEHIALMKNQILDMQEAAETLERRNSSLLETIAMLRKLDSD